MPLLHILLWYALLFIRIVLHHVTFDRALFHHTAPHGQSFFTIVFVIVVGCVMLSYIMTYRAVLIVLYYVLTLHHTT